MKRRDGFTLAEVLITLTIIGVISALTLPAIQSNTAASRNRAALKKAMATISQAAMNNMATEGWNFAHIGSDCGNDEDAARDQNSMDDDTICGLMNSNLAGETYLGFIKSYGRPENGEWKYPNNAGFGSSAWNVYYQLADGAIIGLNTDVTYCTEEKRTNSKTDSRSWCGGFIDVNGLQGPHRVIACADGTATYLDTDDDATCEVERTTNADIFPIVFYDNTVELASDAARSFLNAR